MSTRDCVVDQTSQQKSEILAISPTFNLCWYSVCEGGGRGDTGEKGGDSGALVIENLAVMTKNELCAELRKLDHRKEIILKTDVTVVYARVCGNHTYDTIQLVDGMYMYTF